MRHLVLLTRYIKRHWYVPVVLLADALVFFTVDPRRAPSLVLMLGLLLLIVTVYFAIRLALYIAAFGIPSIKKREMKLRILLSIVAAFVVGLQSLGQLTAKDLIAVVPLFLIGYFYLTYPNGQKKSEDREHSS